MYKKDKLKKEAISRMKKIGIYKPIIEQFEKDDIVSESALPFGACFWLSDEQKERVKEFEDKHNCLVYHVIQSFVEDMKMECYLYVSPYEEEWEMDNEDLNHNIALCYVNNLDEPYFSEFGSIGFKLSIAKGLIRTA